MNCPNCGAENPDTVKFCGNCGTNLADPAAIPEGQVQQPLAQQPLQPQAPVTYTQQPVYIPVQPAKDRSLALILEILPGLFGFLGFGWIYSGNTSTGIMWLIGFLVWDVISIIVAVFSASLGLICTLPISIALIALSASRLNSYTKNNPQIFRS